MEECDFYSYNCTDCLEEGCAYQFVEETSSWQCQPSCRQQAFGCYGLQGIDPELETPITMCWWQEEAAENALLCQAAHDCPSCQQATQQCFWNITSHKCQLGNFSSTSGRACPEECTNRSTCQDCLDTIGCGWLDGQCSLGSCQDKKYCPDDLHSNQAICRIAESNHECTQVHCMSSRARAQTLSPLILWLMFVSFLLTKMNRHGFVAPVRVINEETR